MENRAPGPMREVSDSRHFYHGGRTLRSRRNGYVMKKSIMQWTGLPEEFGLTLLIVSLILTLVPWLSGSDLGILKVPQVSV